MPLKNKNLEVFRSQIDSIDQQILDLLVEREHIVKKVTETKLAHQLAVFMPVRVQKKSNYIQRISTGKRNRPRLGRRFFTVDHGFI